MGIFNKNDDNENVEDFVLYNSDENNKEDSLNDSEAAEAESSDYSENSQEEVSAENSDVSDETRKLDTNEIDTELRRSTYSYNQSLDDVEVRRTTGPFLTFVYQNRALSFVIAAVLVIAIFAVSVFGLVRFSNPLYGYAQVAVSKENILRTVELEGVVGTGEKYEITSLVSGKVIAVSHEVGDKVKADEVLYQIDDTEAKLALERAKNELDKANSASKTIAPAARIIAPDSGTVQKLNIKQGSSVSAGSQVGILLKSDGSTTPIVSYVSGTVSVLSVSVGRQVVSGQLIASLSSTENSTNPVYDKKSGEIDVQAAQRQLDNYAVKAPISGTIVEKNIKVGDNVGATDTNKPTMVIVDDTKLSLTVPVDEKRIGEIERGQKVSITCNSISDTTFSGEVSSIANEGYKDESGTLLFDVTIVVSDPKNLKAGMTVKAKIILATANNATAVPQKSILVSDGQNALVLVKRDSVSDKDVSNSFDNQLANPNIKVPKGCQLISVKYGVSDGTLVQITDGVALGDIVVYNPSLESLPFVPATTNEKDDKSSSKQSEPDYSTKNKSDEKTDQQVKKEINKMLDKN